jgi:hypothetical protein
MRNTRRKPPGACKSCDSPRRRLFGVVSSFRRGATPTLGGAWRRGVRRAGRPMHRRRGARTGGRDLRWRDGCRPPNEARTGGRCRRRPPAQWRSRRRTPLRGLGAWSGWATGGLAIAMPGPSLAGGWTHSNPDWTRVFRGRLGRRRTSVEVSVDLGKDFAANRAELAVADGPGAGTGRRFPFLPSPSYCL